MKRVTGEDVLAEFKAMRPGCKTTTRRIAARILFKWLVLHPDWVDIENPWSVLVDWLEQGKEPSELIAEFEPRVRASMGWLTLGGVLEKTGKSEIRSDVMHRGYRTALYSYTGKKEIGVVHRHPDDRRLALEIKNADLVTQLLCRAW